MAMAVAVDAKVEAVRAQLPAVLCTGYFNAGSNGPMPQVALDVLVEAAQRECSVGRIVPGTYEGNRDRNRRVAALIADVFNATPDEIALTHSTSEGLSTALNGLTWRPGDEVLTTNLEHPGLTTPLCLLAHRYGVVIRYVDIGHGGGDVVREIVDGITARTRVVALSHLMWSSGAVLPLAEITEVARALKVMVFVDGAQSGGQIPVDLRGLGIDAYAMSGQKWLCGPEATGILYVRKDRWPDIAPTYLRYAQTDLSGYLIPIGGAMRYEIGEFYGPAVLAKEAALRWLRDEVGLDWAYERTAMLGRRCWDGLNALDGVTVTTPRDRMTGPVCFTVDGITPQDLTARMYERGMTIRYVAYPPGPTVARVANGWWNTEDEVDALVAAVAEVASEVGH